jgi:hypothetical protein
MSPMVPQDVHHTVEEPRGDPRRPLPGSIDSVALLTRNEPRSPPPVVVGGRELVDGAVPTRYGPPEIADAEGWRVEGPLDVEPLPQGRRGLSARFLAPARPDAAQLDALPSGSRQTEDIRAGLAASPTVNRYHTLRTAARSWPALREGAPAGPCLS